MKKSLENQPHCPRRRFDFVIGNPPYVGYNESSKQGVLIFELMKKGGAKLNDMYGVNLHSIPDNRKKYAPKPNLYAFFIALGLALLKDNGRFCYIIPQTILTAGDLDVLRYHLSKYTTIYKIITFSGNMFIGRGLKQNQPVATSSLILVLGKQKPSLTHQVEVINYELADEEVEITTNNIRSGKGVKKKSFLQSKLIQNVANWNFIKQGKPFLDFYEEYIRKSDDISIYYNHAWAEHQFKSRFYFDKGLVFPKNRIFQNDSADIAGHFHLIDLDKNRYKAVLTNQFVKGTDIKIPQGSQGISVFEKKYKILWSYMNYDKFYFCDKQIIISFNQVVISSDNMSELLYLLSIMNSPMIHLVLDRHLRSESEKDVLLGIKAIKEFVRVPKIAKNNQLIKDEIFIRTEDMLALEDVTLSELVNFSGIMIQKFDDVLVGDNKLMLIRGAEKTRCKIKKDADLVKKIINEAKTEGGLFADNKITLSSLKSLLAIDFDKQRRLKDYIDDLVFALYFSVPIKKSASKMPRR